MERLLTHQYLLHFSFRLIATHLVKVLFLWKLTDFYSNIIYILHDHVARVLIFAEVICSGTILCRMYILDVLASCLTPATHHCKSSKQQDA